jgi:hypothetical protein
MCDIIEKKKKSTDRNKYFKKALENNAKRLVY